MKRALGNLERQLFAYAQMRKLRALRTRDLTGPLGISGKQERELLNRLAKAALADASEGGRRATTLEATVGEPGPR